jgi:DNA-directed RNA polymerase subunit beta'
MAGAVDTLVGLKENVILGHLIPAGTAYGPHQNIQIKYLVDPPDADPAADRPTDRSGIAPAPLSRIAAEMGAPIGT